MSLSYIGLHKIYRTCRINSHLTGGLTLMNSKSSLILFLRVCFRNLSLLDNMTRRLRSDRPSPHLPGSSGLVPLVLVSPKHKNLIPTRLGSSTTGASVHPTQNQCILHSPSPWYQSMHPTQPFSLGSGNISFVTLYDNSDA